MHDSPRRLVGQNVAQFRLNAFLGRGAVGMVFKALDTELWRTVAVRLIPLGDIVRSAEDGLTVHREACERLLLEARAASRLLHPAVVAVQSCGETNEFIYICMEYVSGTSLAQVLEARKTLPVPEALSIFDQVLQAMERAGQEALVHRDLKPANIMIGDNHRVKVMDFGTARLPSLFSNPVADNLGTPDYMSPEQVSGGTVDLRSDIFSVGVVLHEALTGERPFVADSRDALLHKILQEEPIPPRVLNISVPGLLDDLVGKALAKDPDDRFQSPTEMLEALRTIAGSLSERAGTNDEATPVRTAMLSKGAFRPPHDEPAVGAKTGEVAVQGARHDVVVDDHGSRLSPSSTLPAAGVTKVGVLVHILPPFFKRGQGGSEQLQVGKPWHVVRLLSVAAILLGLIVAGRMTFQHLFDVPDEQTALLMGVSVGTKAGNGRDGVVAVEHGDSVASLVYQAKMLWDTEPGASQKLLEQAVALEPGNFEASFQLARLLTFKKDYSAALRFYQNALQINNQVPDVFFNLGYIFQSQGDLDEAIESYESCQALTPPYLDEVLTNLAVCYWKKNNPDRARVLLKQALDFNPRNELARNYLNVLDKSGKSKK